MFELRSQDEAETVEIGRLLGSLLQPGDVVGLDGELGTGKTRLAEGLARAAGFCGEVTSPTFTLVHEYDGRIPLAHVDAYRLADGDELLSLGVSELWEDGVVVIEWADRVSDVLPADAVRLRGTTCSANSRRWSLSWPGHKEVARVTLAAYIVPPNDRSV